MSWILVPLVEADYFPGFSAYFEGNMAICREFYDYLRRYLTCPVPFLFRDAIRRGCDNLYDFTVYDTWRKLDQELHEINREIGISIIRREDEDRLFDLLQRGETENVLYLVWGCRTELTLSDVITLLIDEFRGINNEVDLKQACINVLDPTRYQPIFREFNSN